jgi:hypothetical protein
MKLNAYQCWKVKVEKNLSDEDYKKLLIENGIVKKKDKVMNKEILLVWQGTNEQSSGTVTEIDDMIVVYLDNKSKWEQMEKDIEFYKNRIRVLEKLNFNYREKLGISNEPIDALGLISPLDDVAQAE